MDRFFHDFGVDFVPQMEQKSIKIDAECDENSKMAGRGLKEALGTHFEASWEASRGHGQFLQDIIGAPAPPERR